MFAIIIKYLFIYLSNYYWWSINRIEKYFTIPSERTPLPTDGIFILKYMNFKNYLGYKVYENGSIVNKKNVTLKPQRKDNYLFYKLSINGKGKRISAGTIVLFAFEIYPKIFNQKVKHIDGNYENNSLNNLKW